MPNAPEHRPTASLRDLTGWYVVQRYREWIRNKYGELATLEGCAAFAVTPEGGLAELYHTGSRYAGPCETRTDFAAEFDECVEQLRDKKALRVATILLSECQAGQDFGELNDGRVDLGKGPDGEQHGCGYGDLCLDPDTAAGSGLDIRAFDPRTGNFTDLPTG